MRQVANNKFIYKLGTQSVKNLFLTDGLSISETLYQFARRVGKGNLHVRYIALKMSKMTSVNKRVQ
jgi:hypothetical protein